MDMIALGAVAVAASLCALIVRQKVPELAAVLGLAACALLLAETLPVLETVQEILKEMTALAEISPVILRPVLQTVGLAIVTKLAGSLCRDVGESGIAAFLETAGAAAAVLVSLPLLKMVLQMVSDLL